MGHGIYASFHNIRDMNISILGPKHLHFGYESHHLTWVEGINVMQNFIHREQTLQAK